ncbi:hypothetical protein L6452_05847 [Arctium lappa]|uniref:Uncharacterized protein n=1 Tax=Arctium lappa TaxID=4217 RepID=A0ACB9EGY3_ARCLA|nr:hypothetical protein L6452_05847 [Arctium lappa]
MMVFGHSATGGGFLPGKQQVFLVDYEADVSQCLLQASYSGDLKSAFDCIDDPYVEGGKFACQLEFISDTILLEPMNIATTRLKLPLFHKKNPIWPHAIGLIKSDWHMSFFKTVAEISFE